MLLGLLAYASWQLFSWTHGHHDLIGDVWFYPFDLAAAVSAHAASRRCKNRRQLRSAWRLLALGLYANFMGDFLWTIYEAGGSAPSPSVADVFYLLFYPLTLWGVLRFPVPRGTTARRVRRALDLAVVAIGGTVLLFYVYLGPTILHSGGGFLEDTVSIAYPVGDAVLLVALASVLMRANAPSMVRPIQLMALGFVAYIVADLVYGYIELHSSYHGGNPNDTVYLVSMALMTLAGAAQGVPGARPEAERAAGRSRASWAPYVSIAIAFGVLLVIRRNDGLINLGVVCAVGMLLVLISLRQFLAQRDLITAQRRLRHQSLHDALTGLPNRALVADRAERMIARARRNGSRVAVLFIDLDGFKAVNDTWGHAAGDEILRVVAERLRETVRDADTVGRLAGDEFVVLLEDLTLDVSPELVAERIIGVLAQPVEIADTRRLNLSASVGIAFGPGESVEELLRDADLALYEAKARGRSTWVTFESQMATAAQDRVELEMDLKEALERDEFFLLYQPTFELRTETMSGVEALIRWRHPTRGVLTPDHFIPIAEEIGLLVPIGHWVLQTACRQALEWQAAERKLSMSVNLSARQLDHPHLVEQVAETLIETGLRPDTLTLEITESALMRDPDLAAQQLRELKDIGVRIAIDDFGTGYSSLAYLRQFDVDALKIDRSFISGIASSSESKALIHTLVQLGKTLGLETLGEGIEERAQLRALQREHCDSGQGFLFARPLEPDAIDQMLPAAALG